MVVRGRISKRKKAESPRLKSPTQQIDKIASLTRLPMRDEALKILHDIAIMVAPIMRENNFKVGLLCEFQPKSQNLLGLNVNRGAKICIRLRFANNLNSFIPMGELIGTMLHELTHIRHGPHDASFYKFYDGLRSRFDEVQIRGSLETTGFVGFNNVLGGNFRGDVRSERLKKLEETRNTYISERRKLGGKKVRGKTMRELIAEATERRLKDTKWCTEESGDVPDDDELQMVDVVDLAESEEGSSECVTSKKPEKDAQLRKAEQKVEVIDLTSD